MGLKGAITLSCVFYRSVSEFAAASGEGDRDTMTSTKMLLLLLSMALVALCSAQAISDGKLGRWGIIRA